MRGLLLTLAVLVGAVLLAGVVAWIVGRSLPAEHVAQRARVVQAPLAQVAARVRAVQEQPTWRPGVSRIELIAAPDGPTATGVMPADAVLRYVEHGPNGAIPFAFREVAAGERFTSTIDSDSLPFGGAWTIELVAESPQATRVTITEQGVVRAPLFRTMARYVFGHTRTIDQYLDALQAATR